MKKGLFTGWKDVFSFTFKQDTKGKFRKSTMGVAIVVLLVGMAISVIMAIVQKSDSEDISPIQTVHVINESDLTMLPLEQFGLMNTTGFPEVTFVTEEGTAETVAATLGEKPKDTILKLTNTEEGYRMTLILPENSEISEGEGKDFLNAFEGVMETAKLISSGIPLEKLSIAMSGVNVESQDAGEKEKSLGEELISIFLPMIFVLVMYIMTLTYGMTMGNAVSVEKTSKLMEMMLTLTKPYALIFGKILALTVAAVTQMLVWLVSFGGGFVLGDYVAKTAIYPEYNNVIMEVFKLIREQGGGSAFSLGAYIMIAIEICVGFLFFCLLAATFGSLAEKTEEVAQNMGYYQIIVVIGFMAAYMIPMQEKPWMTNLARLFPLSSAFMLPGDTLIGNITLLQSVLYTLLLLAVTLVLILVSGKVYKDQLFHRGETFLARMKRKKKKSIGEMV
ncbi:MAG: ABC transporter permease [Acetatifactor sp.]